MKNKSILKSEKLYGQDTINPKHIRSNNNNQSSVSSANKELFKGSSI